MSNNLIIPIVLWGKKPPTHRISSLYASADLSLIATGCRDGQLILWEHFKSTITPKWMLFGHTSSIVSITSAIDDTSSNCHQIISASDVGEVCLWDVSDGRCVEQIYLPGSPSQIFSCELSIASNLQKCVLCYGQFSEILILNASNLEVVITLASRIFPDWMASVVTMPCHQDTNTFSVLGLTVSGMFKVWHIHSVSSSSMMFEEESKQISCPAAISMSLSETNCGILIVCSSVWLVCDSGDYSILCSERAELGQQWLGGDFLFCDTILVWDRTGLMYLYKLPFDGSSQETFRSSLQNHSKFMAQLVRKFSIVENQQFLLPPAVLFCNNMASISPCILVGTCDGVLTCAEVSGEGAKPVLTSSLKKLWNDFEEKPIGIIDQLRDGADDRRSITATLFIFRYSYLCCGREDGTIVLVSAAKTCSSHLLCSEGINKKSSLPHKTLRGHKDKVTCLLYPHQDAPERYSQQFLISGSADFSVILWNMFTGVLTHSFHIHGGELSQLIVPPAGCNSRISQSVCSVANDHSVALLNMRDRKCIFLASRHPSPISAIHWRPDYDFLLISCADSTLYVWQMETGHLDRFEQGATAADIISACNEDAFIKTNESSQDSVNLSQALKAKSLTLFKTVAQQGLRSLIESLEPQKQNSAANNDGVEDIYKAMIISPLRASPAYDSDAHVVFINTEVLIARLLMEHLFKGKLNSAELQSNSSLGNSVKHGIFSDLLKQIQNQFVDEEVDFSVISSKRKHHAMLDVDSAIDIAKFVVSSLHAWGLDPAIDNHCKERLGLMIPRTPICFGALSQNGNMALLLPKYSEVMKKDNLLHWMISSALTTQHLVSIISLANTMMELPHTSFKPIKSRRPSTGTTDSDENARFQSFTVDQSQVKQSWSLLAALHCVLLPEKMASRTYKPPKLELLARRWQDRCLELREAAQALMLAELRQIGAHGRRQIVATWSQHVPDYVYQSSAETPQHETPYFSSDEVGDRSLATNGGSSYISRLSLEARRRHATAIVILGVIGAEFGQEFDPCGTQRHDVPEGFGLSDSSLARQTCKALVYLLLQPSSPKLPAHVPLRRAAIDLLGRGFTVWEPYMEVAAVLLGLLELCETYSKHSSSIQSGFPLTPEMDSCRSAHHSLSLIATARPLTFVTTIAREVARYNAAVANPQHQSLLATSVLVRCKPEVLRVIELLADKMTFDLHSVLVEVVDIVLFCIDVSFLRASYGLLEAVPALAKFHTISYDARSRRVAVAGSHGSIILYDIRSCKHQVVPRGSGAITALCFSPDGKYLSVYCSAKNQLSFWMTATSLFGMLQSQVKCVKTINPLKMHPKSHADPPTSHSQKVNPSKLVWVNNRSVVLLTPDGSELRFHV